MHAREAIFLICQNAALRMICQGRGGGQVVRVHVFHPAASGSNPKHTIYAFINLNLNLNCDMLKRRKRTEKEAEIGPFLKGLICI